MCRLSNVRRCLLMSKLVIVCMVLVGCSDQVTPVLTFDAPEVPIDAYQDLSGCPTSGVLPTCGTTTAPAVPASATTGCDPLTQTGCAAGEKCTNIGNLAVSKVGCAPVGTAEVGCPCSLGQEGPFTGYDDCVAGSVCTSGPGASVGSRVCRPICGLQGAAPTCGGGTTCVTYGKLFEVGGSPVAGVCDDTCDPLTQCTSVSQRPNACGSADPTMPDRSCIGVSSYRCNWTSVTNVTLTDRQVPRTNASGLPYVNGCAPGFIPLYYSMTGSTQTLCTGFCAALETDNTPAHVNNGKGDPTALAKLPTAAKPLVGDGTCEIGKKGSDASSKCLFIWPLLEDGQGALPPDFANSSLVDTLGVCMAISFFRYDSNNDTTPDTPFPDCATLPPRSAATTTPFDDAADWSCQKRVNSMVTSRRNPTLGDVRIGTLSPVPLVRHTLLD